MSGLLHAAGAPMGGPVRTQVPEIACSVVPGVRDACLLADVASEAGNSVIDGLVATLLSGLATLLRMGMTWWTAFPSPQLSSSAGQPVPVLTQIREYTSGLQVVLLTAGIMFAAARLALAKRSGVAGEAQETFLMFARAIFAAMTFATLITVGTHAGDEFSNWVIFDATRGDLENSVARLLDPEIMANLGPGILLVVGVFGVISMIIQLVMLVVRQALLVVVVAVIPLAASASGTAPGSQAYKRLLGWSLAFVLWKPVGALVYAIAFTVVGSEDQTDPQLMLLGLILMLMSVIVLPALIRLIAPAVATLGGGGGATSVLAGAGVGIGMSAVGSRPTARRMTEGENSATPAGSTPGGNRPPSGGGSTARPMAPISASGGSASPPGSAGQASSTPVGAGAGGASAPAGTAGRASARKASGAMAAGPAGAAMLGAQLAVGALQGIVSTAQTAIPDSSSAQIDPDALGPGEVRR
ncbi:hypothetical protein ACFWM1_26740 [Nocardia sp. NPDC058379]|uniref:hypothetical protein n=1 Tax=unclassified Nocardia TaxID=2637762 RepID=UPI00364BA9B7